MKITLRQLRNIINEEVKRLSESSPVNHDSDINVVEVGDMVDVDTEYMGTLPVRVTELVDDVNAVAGSNEDDPTGVPGNFSGPGFVGEIDPDSGEGGELVFSLNQVVPGSKAKYYFPKLGTELENGRTSDWDEYGRDVPNPYRRMAQRQITKSREPSNSYASGLDDDFNEDVHGRKNVLESNMNDVTLASSLRAAFSDFGKTRIQPYYPAPGKVVDLRLSEPGSVSKHEIINTLEHVFAQNMNLDLEREESINVDRFNAGQFHVIVQAMTKGGKRAKSDTDTIRFVVCLIPKR